MAARKATRLRQFVLSFCFMAWLPVTAVSAASCTVEDLGKAVDAAGAGLREVNAQNAPELQARMKRLKALKGWSDADYEEKAYDYLQDDRIANLDGQANELLVNIDGLGRPPEDGSPPDCSRLNELKAASAELLAVMKAKTQYTLAKLDKELAKTAAAEPAPGKPAASLAPPPQQQPQPKPEASRPAPAARPSTGWTTTTEVAPTAGVGVQPPPQGVFLSPEEDGYTIEEIRDATKGFFGGISTSLAAVLEHSFSKSGRPTAYVLGAEGGGAFLAGLRYGEGTLYLRQGGTQKVYWHGPSLGYDFGAAGSRTLFLIYRLREPEGLFRRFTGVDGSAYLVGGVGITYLKGGDVVMAPIRSGLGLRVGASVGYVRFTPRPTWNPF